MNSTTNDSRTNSEDLPKGIPYIPPNEVDYLDQNFAAAYEALSTLGNLMDYWRYIVYLYKLFGPQFIDFYLDKTKSSGSINIPDYIIKYAGFLDKFKSKDIAKMEEAVDVFENAYHMFVSSANMLVNLAQLASSPNLTLEDLGLKSGTQAPMTPNTQKTKTITLPSSTQVSKRYFESVPLSSSTTSLPPPISGGASSDDEFFANSLQNIETRIKNDDERASELVAQIQILENELDAVAARDYMLRKAEQETKAKIDTLKRSSLGTVSSVNTQPRSSVASVATSLPARLPSSVSFAQSSPTRETITVSRSPGAKSVGQQSIPATSSLPAASQTRSSGTQAQTGRLVQTDNRPSSSIPQTSRAPSVTPRSVPVTARSANPPSSSTITLTPTR